MLGEERMITGPEAGITRDSISLEWQWQGRSVRLVDTAGLRKRAKIDDKLERLSAADTRRAIDYAEVVVLLLDATRGLESQDLRIADQVIEEGRALILALNKWDVAENASALFNGVKAALAEGLSQLRDVPLLTVSGKTGKGIDTILEVAFELREAWSKRVPTGELNRWFEEAVAANPPPAPKGKRIKLRYITQVKSRPPSFVVFGNRLEELPDSYRRYLLNAMRRDLKLGPVPLRLDFRGRSNPFDRSAGKGRR
jgi:GTPase